MPENPELPLSMEHERVRCPYEDDILECIAEPHYESLVQLASRLFNLPIAFITLIAEQKQWLKASTGLPDLESADLLTFCEHTVAGSVTFEVKDASSDERFAQNPLVTGATQVRYFAGAPLIDEAGFKLGTICVMDTKPNLLCEEQKQLLATLAQQAMMHLSIKLQKRALKDERKRLQEMLNITSLSPEIHAILTNDGTILFINEAVTNLLGYTVAQAMQMNFWDVCYSEDKGRVWTAIEQGLINKEKQFDQQFRLVGQDGRIRWFSWSMVAENARWYTYGRDITETKKVQRELLKLSFVASKVNNAVVINDANNQVTWINEAFEKITGFTLEDIKGKRLGDLISGPLTDLKVIEEARTQAKNNKSFTIDVLAYRKDKEPMWLSIYNTVILDEVGQEEIEVEIIIDISEKKQAEREMIEAKEQALQLSEAKEMFLSVMSHEIRTPLNAVIGMSHLLLENDPKPTQVEDLNILKFSAENLLHIINDILDFTKIETGNLQLEHVPFSLKTLANDILYSLQVSANKNKNQVRLDYDAAIPDLILGDKTRLYQILMNLLGNAIKFTNSGLVILNMELAGTTAAEVLIRFQVKDNGIGIPQDKQSYIFESFTQAKTDISRKYGGTGLGLAITKKLLKLYNSDIEVYSVEKQGTTFTFTITLGKVEPNQQSANLGTGTNAFTGYKVLVVDDNDINILIAKRILSKWGIEVGVASSGEEAIEQVKKNEFDLILMDIKMPGIDGYETTGMIRKLPGAYYQSVPIVALTASSIYEENGMYEQSGMNGHLMKPFNPDDIKRLLSTILKPESI
jgi:PAS domain S-box-containing protein